MHRTTQAQQELMWCCCNWVIVVCSDNLPTFSPSNNCISESERSWSCPRVSMWARCGCCKVGSVRPHCCCNTCTFRADPVQAVTAADLNISMLGTMMRALGT
jgi:hypothetical protein